MRHILATDGQGPRIREVCQRYIARHKVATRARLGQKIASRWRPQKVSIIPDLRGWDGFGFIPLVADIADPVRTERVFSRHRPAVVFHAAAYKHVPMLEAHPEEAIIVNVWGTWHVCQFASQYNCERFVLVSTDKAVHPTSILGFSKRLGEMIARAQEHSETVHCSVRFGNVIASRGSALPEFVRQIDAGGPVTITHPEVKRYFMTIREAVSLVIQAAAMAEGSELFMLDMGESIKILDIVNRIIRMRGLRVGKDVHIMYTGLRPGEKLDEELFSDSEKVCPTASPSIYSVVENVNPSLRDMEESVILLKSIATQGDPTAIRSTLIQTMMRMSVVDEMRISETA